MATAPIDLVHLERQTMNDAELQREILGIFAGQTVALTSDLIAAQGEERKRLAHKLKGAAHAVGAFALADCAARLMEQPDDEGALASLLSLAAEAGDYATSLIGSP